MTLDERENETYEENIVYVNERICQRFVVTAGYCGPKEGSYI